MALPILPEISEGARKTFFREAPIGTIILVDFGGEEVFRKVEEDVWRNLDELITVGPAYLTYETWEESTDQEMLEYCGTTAAVYLVSTGTNER